MGSVYRSALDTAYLEEAFDGCNYGDSYRKASDFGDLIHSLVVNPTSPKEPSPHSPPTLDTVCKLGCLSLNLQGSVALLLSFFFLWTMC